MNDTKLFRTAGWCALASVILIPIAMVLFIFSGSAPIAGMVGMIFEIISMLLLVYVFYALSVAHRSESKWLGFAGLILFIASIVVDVVSQQTQTAFLFGLFYLLFSMPLALLAGGITFIAGVIGLLGNSNLADSIQQFSILFMLAWAVWLWRVLVSKKFAAA
jgi:hypothetical protein